MGLYSARPARTVTDNYVRSSWLSGHRPCSANRSVNGTRYFTCAPKHGGFVKPGKVEVGDFPPIDIMDELEDDEDEEL